MSAQQRRDAAYGRRGGGWRDNADEPLAVQDAPRCEVCGLAMMVGQKKRHALCSPMMPCCDFHEDLVRDKAKHERMHAQILAVSHG